MKYNYLIKAFAWSVISCLSLTSLLLGLWFHPVMTLIIVSVLWITLMRYLDPPEKWDL